MPNISVSAGEFRKSYGRISEAALREPVTITSHGRERLVLLSADEYRRLKEKDRQALYPGSWTTGTSRRSKPRSSATIQLRLRGGRELVQRHAKEPSVMLS